MKHVLSFWPETILYSVLGRFDHAWCDMDLAGTIWHRDLWQRATTEYYHAVSGAFWQVTRLPVPVNNNIVDLLKVV